MSHRHAQRPPESVRTPQAELTSAIESAVPVAHTACAARCRWCGSELPHPSPFPCSECFRGCCSYPDNNIFGHVGSVG